MRFSDTTNKNGIIQTCEFITGLGDAGISGNSELLKIFTNLINQRNFLINSIILESQDEWEIDDLNYTDFPIATTDLVADQRDYSLFSISPKILKLNRIDIAYDGTNFHRATPLQSREIDHGLGNADKTDDHFEKTSPRYSLNGRSVLIYPRASAEDVSNSGKIRAEFARAFEEFESTDTTAEPGIDKIWHKMLPIGASLDYAEARGGTNAAELRASWADYEQRLRNYYGSKQQDRDYQLDSHLGFQEYK